MNIFGMGSRFGLSDFEQIAIVGVLVAAFISLLYAWYLRGGVLQKDKGTAKMQEVWNAIRIGADSYLSRQLRTILPLIAVLTFVMFFSVFIVPPTEAALKEFGEGAQLWISIGRAVAFIMGASFSLMVGQLGMRMAIQANVRVASASRRGFNEALSIAYYSGTITGMLTDGTLSRLSVELEAASLSGDVARVQALGVQYQTTEAELGQRLNAWAELA